MLQCDLATVLQCDLVTVLQCDLVTVLQCDLVTGATSRACLALLHVRYRHQQVPGISYHVVDVTFRWFSNQRLARSHHLQPHAFQVCAASTAGPLSPSSALRLSG